MKRESLKDYEDEIAELRLSADDMMVRCENRFEAIDTAFDNLPLGHLLTIYVLASLLRAVTVGVQLLSRSLRRK